MSFASFDFISPKITLNYNGRNSHVSRLGGFLSLCLLFILCIIIFYCFWDFFHPRYYSSFVYEENTNENLIHQSINYSGINHFLQIYSNSDNGWFGDINNKNIIIYAIKENNNLYGNNYLNIELSSTDHWLYDKCDKIKGINSNLFKDISKFVSNYTKSICLRFYYNSSDKKYYEIGKEGYVEPYIETNNINKKKFSYKIIIKKCYNNTFINKNMGYICNSENNISKYFNIYNEIFVYFTYNQIIPINHHSPFQRNIYSISSTLNPNSYFEHNIIFLPIKFIKKGSFNKLNKDTLSYSIYNHFQYTSSNINEKQSLIGVFNLYLHNNIRTYQFMFSNLIDILSQLGGAIKIFFLIFKIINYFNHRFTLIENTRTLFKINTGIESNYFEPKEVTFDKLRHIATNNFKINHLIANEDLSRKLMKNFSPMNHKKKFKFFDDISPINKHSSKKNLGIYPINISSNKKNNLINYYKKNSYSFNNRNIDKRKSYLSQIYRVKSKENRENKDYSIFIKNHSYNENEIGNNEVPSSREQNKNNTENNSIANNQKESNVKNEPSKIINEYNQNKSRKSKKLNLNLKFPPNKIFQEKIDNSHLALKNQKRDNHIRHKSINYTNQKKLFRNSIFNKNYYYLKSKDSSEVINDSSKQILVNNKNLLLAINNKTQNDKNKNDDNNCRLGLMNNNTELANSTKNLNTVLNNVNGNIETSIFLRNLVKNKLKLEISEAKDNLLTNSILKKIKHVDFFKSLFICNGKNENKINLINIFKNKLLSEEHLYRNHINLCLILKIFQIEEAYKFDFKDIYNNI